FDEIRDDAAFEWEFIDDQVIVKSDGFPTYHLAATCDDHEMEITHVIRGEEWISSTPKHLFIYDALGWTPPTFAHLPLLLNADKSKLSKRQGDVAAEDYLAKGYLPEALVNFVALLGWNPTGDREIYSREELTAAFDLKKINKAGAVFNLEKLNWLNQQYLRSMPQEDYLARTHPFIADTTDDHAFADRVLLLLRDRVTFPRDVKELAAPFFHTTFDFQHVPLTWKTQSREEARQRLEGVRDLLATIDEREFTKEGAPKEMEDLLKTLIHNRGWGNGDTLWPLRVALSGSEKSPTPFELLWAYGKKRSTRRMEDAIQRL
ncbi:MAG: glutamate--tRNA ligase family protein, partial [Patescibacteria group bacterium]